MAKTVLLIDDEQGFLEALEDALTIEGYKVLKADSGEQALEVLANNSVHLASVDVMLPPGKSLEEIVSSQQTGLYLAQRISQQYPEIDIFCISVVNDPELIAEIRKTGARFLRKGETPLRTVVNMMRSRLTGLAYSTERPR